MLPRGCPWCRLLVLSGLGLIHAWLDGPLAWAQSGTTNSFVNWETAPVHPIEFVREKQWVLACNLSDNRLYVIDVRVPRDPKNLFDCVVGLDPVSVRARTPREAWVVSQVSDAFSIVDLESRAVVAVIRTPDEPADVVFAGHPQRAFISCYGTDEILVVDPETRVAERRITLNGRFPRSLAASPDGSVVYVAMHLSGNASTILAQGPALIRHPRPAGPADFVDSPSQGKNPFPNTAKGFDPPINPAVTVQPPRVPVIVKKDGRQRWLDDRGGDWTDWVSGENAPLSGRTPRWDMPDNDVFEINATTFQMRPVSGLMNVCAALAVNPASGGIAVVGTDGLNERRFEPVLSGIFHRVLGAVVEAGSLARQVIDLNPHLDYHTNSIPKSQRSLSIGDPRAVAWSGDGKLMFVAGMGSGNIVVLNEAFKRVGDPIVLGEFPGPVGLAVDDDRKVLYVLNRFEAGLVVVDLEPRRISGKLAFFDPTPTLVRRGRQHFYDTHKTSGLGQASCASCHPDARSDGLAWDLGAPNGDEKKIGTNFNFGNFDPPPSRVFHPMKGPMVTQTLQDIIGHEPFHWRGDRDGIEEFNPTFTDLQGADEELTPQEMGEFKAFLSSISMPPNPVRNRDNTLPTSLPLTGHTALGRGSRRAGALLPNGNAQRGFQLFGNTGDQGGCIECHTVPTGLGPDRRWNGTRWVPIPRGTNDEAHVTLFASARTEDLPFKIPQLRNLRSKRGFSLTSTNSLAGFGFFHDGSVDSLVRFLQDGFPVFDADQDCADMVAFLLAFGGSDLVGSDASNKIRPPGPASKDVAAGVGLQWIATSTNAPADLLKFLPIATRFFSRIELVAFASTERGTTGWLLERDTGAFRPEDPREPALRVDELVGRCASENRPVLFMAVPEGSGMRISMDRDVDGFTDYEEMLAGSNPNDSASQPPAHRIRRVETRDGLLLLTLTCRAGHRYAVETTTDVVAGGWTAAPGEWRAEDDTLEITQPIDKSNERSYFRVRRMR